MKKILTINGNHFLLSESSDIGRVAEALSQARPLTWRYKDSVTTYEETEGGIHLTVEVVPDAKVVELFEKPPRFEAPPKPKPAEAAAATPKVEEPF